MSFETTQTWLKVASAIVIGFGLVIAISALPAASGPMRFMLDAVFWPVDGAPAGQSHEIRLLSAISGGIMTGWGVLLWQLASRLLPREPELARNLILTSIITWFVIDSAGSIAAGVSLNALLNVGFLAMFVAPLWRLKEPLNA